jgi:hypothetical protein
MGQRARHTYVFLVRTWSETRNAHLLELRGMVRNLHSGETRYFRTWGDLLGFIERDFEEQERSEDAHDGSSINGQSIDETDAGS